MQSVVKLHVQTCTPDYSIPWQRKRQYQTSGSGFPISNRRILTNAHVVADQTSVRIEKHGDPKKYDAHVVHTSHECDLAVVGVDDERFWQGLEPLEFGGIPECQDDVVVVGFPEGGDSLCVTAGVVSRIEVLEYGYSGRYLLAIQIDAAINGGNSGGPTLKDGEVVGIAFESYDDIENVGYIIPIPVIEHFLLDVEQNGHYSGFCTLGIQTQNIESVQMRKYLELGEDDTGVLIFHVSKTSCNYGKFLLRDVLMELDGVKIADNGSIPFRGRERIHMNHLVYMKFPGDTMDATVLRAGKKISIKITAGAHSELIPHLYNVQPSYVVYCGLVFTTLSHPYLQHRFDDDWISDGPIRFSHLVFNENNQEEKDQNVVILSQVLASDVTTGYEGFSNVQLFCVNGIPVVNLHNLCHLLDQISLPHVETTKTFNKDLFVENEDEPNHHNYEINVNTSSKESPQTLNNQHSISSKSSLHTTNNNDQDVTSSDFINFQLERNQMIVLEIEPALKKSGDILKTYGIHSSRSQDLPPQDY